MDTYYQPEAPLVTAAPLPPARDSGASIAVLAIAVIAWVVLNAWSVNFVAHGVIAAGLVPSDIPEWSIFAFATGLQVCVALLGLLTPLFFRPFRVLRTAGWMFCLAVCLMVVGFEGFHMVFRGLQLSTGTGLERAEEAEVGRIDQSITDISQQIPILYEGKRAAFLALANDAKAGRDRTGIAACGDICKGHFALYSTVTARFGHLASSAVPPPSAVKADVRSRLIDSRHRFDSLKAAEASLVDFYAAIDKSAPPRMITDAITQLQNTLVSKDREYAGVAIIDAKNLALVRTTEAFTQLATGKMPRQDTLLPLVYGLLPALAITTLGILIRVIVEARRTFRNVARLRQELADEEEAAPVLQRLLRVRSRNFLDRLRADFRRWDRYDFASTKRRRAREPAE